MTVDGPQQLTGYVVRDYEHLIAALAASRESQRLTFAEVARRIGRCYLQQVFNWLNGGSECRARRLFDLADALGYDLALIPRDTEPVERTWGRTEPDGPIHTPDGPLRRLVATGWRTGWPETAPASTHSAEPAPARGSDSPKPSQAPWKPVAGLRNDRAYDEPIDDPTEGAQTSTGDDA
jgi:hypothetical protein